MGDCNFGMKQVLQETLLVFAGLVFLTMTLIVAGYVFALWSIIGFMNWIEKIRPRGPFEDAEHLPL